MANLPERSYVNALKGCLLKAPKQTVSQISKIQISNLEGALSSHAEPQEDAGSVHGHKGIKQRNGAGGRGSEIKNKHVSIF
jgi:hypothetical protein